MPWLNQPQDRSLACNGELIAHFRKERGWTQEDLAGAVGYSTRLIAKAEAGNNLDPRSIECIAEALSYDGLIVFPEDLTASPRELAASFLQALCDYEADMVAKCRHFLSEDLEVFIPGGPESAPLSGVHKGIDGLDAYMRNLFLIFGRPDKDLAKNTAVINGDGNRVVIACFEKFTNELIPPDVPGSPLSLFMAFSRGKLRTIQFLFDSAEFGKVVDAWRSKHPGEVELGREYMGVWSTTNGMSTDTKERTDT